MPKPDYFELFDLPRHFDIDIDALDEAYFAAQKEMHPDQYMKMSPEEQSQMMKISAGVNLAYKTLKNRFQRAEYLIDNAELNASPELLMEMMELREEEPAQAKEKVEKEMEGLFEKFAEDNSAEIFVRIKYLAKFLEEVRA